MSLIYQAPSHNSPWEHDRKLAVTRKDRAPSCLARAYSVLKYTRALELLLPCAQIFLSWFCWFCTECRHLLRVEFYEIIYIVWASV